MCIRDRANSEGETFDHIDKLEQSVENKVVQNRLQKRQQVFLKRIIHFYCRNFKRHNTLLYKKVSIVRLNEEQL